MTSTQFFPVLVSLTECIAGVLYLLDKDYQHGILWLSFSIGALAATRW